MGAEGLVMEGLATTADRTRMDIVSDECDHLGPVELVTDILNHIGDARVASKMVVVMGAEYIQLDLLIVGDVEQSLVAKEVAIL